MDAYVGRSLLVGLTFVDTTGAVLERRQFLGEVAPGPAGDQAGLCVRAPQGEIVVLPADEQALLPAPRGLYRCLVSGEHILDPDLLTSWRVTVTPDGERQWEANYAPHVRPIVPDEWEFTYRQDSAYLRGALDRSAARYLGKHVLITLALYIEQGDADRYLGEEQRRGRIDRASFGEGVVVALDTGKEFRLPPDLSLLQPAPPSANGEGAVRADFVTRWTVVRAAEDDDG